MDYGACDQIRAGSDGARVNILDISYKETKLVFKLNAVVGVGNGMFYCDSTEVADTKVSDAPPEYTTHSSMNISGRLDT